MLTTAKNGRFQILHFSRIISENAWISGGERSSETCGPDMTEVYRHAVLRYKTTSDGAHYNRFNGHKQVIMENSRWIIGCGKNLRTNLASGNIDVRAVSMWPLYICSIPVDAFAFFLNIKRPATPKNGKQSKYQADKPKTIQRSLPRGWVSDSEIIQ